MIYDRYCCILYYSSTICMILCLSQIKSNIGTWFLYVFVGIVHEHSHVLELVTVSSVRQIYRLGQPSSGAGILETLHLSILANGKCLASKRSANLPSFRATLSHASPTRPTPIHLRTANILHRYDITYEVLYWTWCFATKFPNTTVW